MTELSIEKNIRTLTADDLGIGVAAKTQEPKAATSPDTPEIDPNDPVIRLILAQVRQHKGVILSGPPGTSKSYMANAAGRVVAGSIPERIVFTQFHPAYQYEDFMEGYRPREKGGFERRHGVFMEICERASNDPGHDYVIVIDELSRGDAARVFGEALTYIEVSKRGMRFLLPSGLETSIPMNIYILATMNPLDRGVDEVDAAFERRFVKIEMLPDSDLLAIRLKDNGLEEPYRSRLLEWFRWINLVPTPAAHLGHAYFWNVTDMQSLREIWDFQVKYHVGRAFRYDDDSREEAHQRWGSIFVSEEV